MSCTMENPSTSSVPPKWMTWHSPKGFALIISTVLRACSLTLDAFLNVWGLQSWRSMLVRSPQAFWRSYSCWMLLTGIIFATVFWLMLFASFLLFMDFRDLRACLNNFRFIKASRKNG